MQKYGNTISLDCATLLGWCVAMEGNLTDWGEVKLERGEVDLWELLNNLNSQYHPKRVIAENIFLKDNVKTFQRLANYHGVIALFCQLNGIELITKGYQPTEWKRALTGDSRASKERVLTYVNNRLRPYIKEPIKSDNIADAIGILLAWAKRERNKQM